MLASHNLVDNIDYTGVIFEKRPCLDPAGNPCDGIYNAWISLNLSLIHISEPTRPY